MSLLWWNYLVIALVTFAAVYAALLSYDWVVDKVTTDALPVIWDDPPHWLNLNKEWVPNIDCHGCGTKFSVGESALCFPQDEIDLFFCVDCAMADESE